MNWLLCWFLLTLGWIINLASVVTGIWITEIHWIFIFIFLFWIWNICFFWLHLEECMWVCKSVPNFFSFFYIYICEIVVTVLQLFFRLAWTLCECLTLVGETFNGVRHAYTSFLSLTWSSHNIMPPEHKVMWSVLLVVKLIHWYGGGDQIFSWLIVLCTQLKCCHLDAYEAIVVIFYFVLDCTLTLFFQLWYFLSTLFSNDFEFLAF